MDIVKHVERDRADERVLRWLSLVALLAASGACASTPAHVREAPIVAPATGPLATWVELPWQGADPVVRVNQPHIHAADGDRVYLLVNDVLYRSDDHGTHWAERSRELLFDFAPFADRLFGWPGSVGEFEWTYDDGQTWLGKPAYAHEGDYVESTGALESPVLFAVLGARAVMVQPLDEERLQVSESPPGGWFDAKLNLRDDFVAWSTSHNRSMMTRVESATTFAGALYACAPTGIFRSRDGGRVWDQLANPDGNMEPFDRCELTSFDTPLCAAFYRWEGRKLFCTTDAATWARADAGLYNETAKKPAWQEWVGFGNIVGTAQAADRWFLAHDGMNPNADNPSGLFETPRVGDKWKQVDALKGVAIVGLARTSSAVLALARDADAHALRLFRFRFK
jgi:hypothetical protein